MSFRLERHEAYMGIAQIMARRGTCRRRQVGAVITDEVGHILSTGYNGPPPGYPHCVNSTVGCVTDPDCIALHAEWNALLQCSVLPLASNIYVTASPCIECAKMLAGTHIHTIYYKEAYPDHSKLVAYWNNRLQRDLIRISGLQSV
jgi:dCMP deaminase